MGSKRKKDEIVKELRTRGYLMMEAEYNGLREKHALIDENGYFYYSRLDNLINSNRMPEKFSQTNPFTLKNIQHYLDETGSDTKVVSKMYKNSHSELLFRCGKCGENYESTANHMISRHSVVCPNCSLSEKGKRHRVPIETVLKEFIKSNLKPLFSTYEGYYIPLKCQDIKGNLCYVTYAALRQWNRKGYSTYLPRHSSYESLVADYLNNIGVLYTKEYTFRDCKDINRLKFDFAIFDSRNDKYPVMLIEVDGQQHFNPVKFKKIKDADNNFEGIKRRDSIKNRYCIRNNIPLLRIPFYDIENGNYKTTISKNISQTLWSSEP